jgi:Flp pilus assembly protein TadD
LKEAVMPVLPILRPALLVAALSLAAPAAAFAVGSDDGGASADAGPSYTDGYAAAMDGEYTKAVEILRDVIDATPEDADAWNMLGFSYRNLGKSDLAWDAYERALTLEPNHKGAHEYLGEWYLMQGDMASAKAQLDKLAAICPDGCRERTLLAEAIEKAEAGS